MSNHILYSFRRCPYAMRARWALLRTNQGVILREVALRNKPQSLLEQSPKGTVPVLITANGEVLEESLDIIYWSIKQSDSTKHEFIGNLDDQYDIQTIIDINDGPFKYHLDRYKYPDRYLDGNFLSHKKSARDILLQLNERLSGQKNRNRWLISGSETIADWAIWPFVRQFRLVDISNFDNDKELNSLKLWLEYFTSNILYNSLMQKIQPWTPDQKDYIFKNIYI